MHGPWTRQRRRRCLLHPLLLIPLLVAGGVTYAMLVRVASQAGTDVALLEWATPEESRRLDASTEVWRWITIDPMSGAHVKDVEYDGPNGAFFVMHGSLLAGADHYVVRVVLTTERAGFLAPVVSQHRFHAHNRSLPRATRGRPVQAHPGAAGNTQDELRRAVNEVERRFMTETGTELPPGGLLAARVIAVKPTADTPDHDFAVTWAVPMQHHAGILGGASRSTSRSSSTSSGSR